MNNWFAQLFGGLLGRKDRSEVSRVTILRERREPHGEISDQDIRSSYRQMANATADETLEEKAAFYNEVGRLLREQKERPQ